jgi:transposase-like protein
VPALRLHLPREVPTSALLLERRARRAASPRPQLRRVERPPYDELLREIAATSWSAVGRRYGVSDNAVRKWVRQYEREGTGGQG